ncbi:MAG: FAD-dependent oxidoreductase [Pseudomonadota bacterium]
MGMIDTDIAVVGGGIAGLAATARLAAVGAEVLCIDPAPAAEESDDLRTTAYLQPAIETLQAAGAWDAMAAESAPLWTMRLVDAGGPQPMVRESCDFTAAELQDRPFGHNVPNRTAKQALRAAVGDRLLDGRTVASVLRREREAILRLSDGTQIRARLVVAADGRDSAVRQGAGIAARRWDYVQRALVFAVRHEAPHRGVSTEIHRTGGPLTLVPMPDREGAPCSAVVWMVPAAEAEGLKTLDNAALSAELTARTLGLFGPLQILGPRAVWPIIGQLASRVIGERLALVAEAAHVIPPIGAQGLNTSLADVETLARLVGEARDAERDIGARALLSRYQMRRWPDMAARVAGVDVLNRFAMAKAQPIRDLRRLGLSAIHRIAPVRQLAMRLGMGASR